jgi:fructokinase
LRIFDVNLRQNYFSRQLVEESLALANVLKVNETELPQLAGMFGLMGESKVQISELAGRYELQAVAFTRGRNGSLLFADGHWSDHPGIRAQVIDTVGAGDSFTAAMALGLLAGWELEQINDSSNRVAAYVCSCAGAMPPLPENLRALFN